jgi:hypothetical protein
LTGADDATKILLAKDAKPSRQKTCGDQGLEILGTTSGPRLTGSVRRKRATKLLVNPDL